jgi:type IV pilus assembly protein PilV
MKKNRGFTLIEVLISMLVLAVGLLGLAGLQATGMRNNLSAQHRSQATLLAYDIADRMRANIVDAQNFATSTYFTQAPAGAAVANCETVTGCTTIQMANNDLSVWNANIVATLPMGQGSITFLGAIYTIAINWDDNRDGCVNPGDADAVCVGQPNDPDFQMSFQL